MRRTAAQSESLKQSVRYDNALRDTFRERSEARAAYNANAWVAELSWKELSKSRDILCRCCIDVECVG
jgi:hypothetical protein